MSDVTRILSRIKQGDAGAADQLLPLVYGELRKLAEAKLAQEQPGHTLQPTALVHEAYLRLVGDDSVDRWDSRGHFFASAAEAMRRILVDQARRKASLKRGGDRNRGQLKEEHLELPDVKEGILDLSDALDRLADTDNQAAELVKLRYFAGLTSEQAAKVLGISPRTAGRVWVYARAFLRREIEGS